MDGSDRVKHLEAQMLSQIRAMDLEPKMMDLIMDEEVIYRARLQSKLTGQDYKPRLYWLVY